LKVIRVRDRLKVESDHVYVIPPNQDMSILHGILHLLDPVDPRGLRRPIDFFLRALADDQRERSMGVILSGMGSDGMLGARAIKEHAGVVFVQTPASAKFDAMPSNTINAGLADVVAPVEELPGKIAAYLGRTPIIVAPVRPLASSTGFLGSAETISATSDLLAPIDGNARLFPRLEGRLRIGPTEFTTPTFLARPRASEAAGQGALKSAADLQILAEQVLLHRYAPAAVLTDGKGDILFISGRTGKYLEPAPGKANWNIYAMAREGLRHVLGVAFQRALREKRQVVVSPARLSADWAGQAVTIAIEPIQAPEALLGTVIVVFTDLVAPAIAPKGKGKPTRAAPPAPARREQELRQALEELRTTHEQAQTSQEELRSANEELQSTYEELQITNEELTTSNEEMQSLNEELQTLKHQLQSKVDELSRTNNDMRNLLDSTDIATLFLDNDLNVRRFTTQAIKIIKLIPGDVGRPITDLALDLVCLGLVEDAREVLRTLVFKKQAVTTRDGRWFTVRIMPYRRLDNRIDGVVMTLMDITAAKTLPS